MAAKISLMVGLNYKHSTRRNPLAWIGIPWPISFPIPIVGHLPSPSVDNPIWDPFGVEEETGIKISNLQSKVFSGSSFPPSVPWVVILLFTIIKGTTREKNRLLGATPSSESVDSWRSSRKTLYSNIQWRSYGRSNQISIIPFARGSHYDR